MRPRALSIDLWRNMGRRLRMAAGATGRAAPDPAGNGGTVVERGFEDAAIGMAVLEHDLTVVRANAALCRLLDRTADEVVGHSILEFTLAEDRTRSTTWADALRDEAPDGVFFKRYVRPNGSTVEAMVTSAWVQPDHGTPYFFSQLQDVTEQRLALRRTAAIAALGRRAVDDTDPRAVMQEATATAHDLLDARMCLVTRRRADASLQVVAATGAEISRSERWPGERTQNSHTLDCAGPVISDDLAAETRFDILPAIQAAGLSRSVSVPVPERAGARHVFIAYGDAETRPFAETDARFLEAVANVVGSALDRAAAEDELRRRALEDPLTGLANRALLMTQLDRELRHGARLGTQVCLLVIDIDRFKAVNDTMGHGVGDALLRQVAARLRESVRDEDLVARLGGDEFVVVCSRTDTDQAIQEVAGRIVDALLVPFTIDGSAIDGHASVGVAVADGTAENPEELLRDADAAMYRAKEAGGGRFEVFDAALRKRLVRRLAIELDLRHAVERDELELHYQPLVDLESENLIGFEALLRWQHPERGTIPPNDFISIAEQTGLIQPIGSWVLAAAFEQLSRWPEPITLSMNLSAAQVGPALVDEIRGLLERYPVRPARVALEITESLVLDPRTKPVIVALRDLGVHVALDDFGTGYSSLGSLQRFPMDVLKLDRSLITSLDRATGLAVVHAAVELGRTLGLHVVAEGIEDREQVEQLRAAGCLIGQGFLFAKPLAAADAADLIAEHATR